MTFQREIPFILMIILGVKTKAFEDGNIVKKKVCCFVSMVIKFYFHLTRDFSQVFVLWGNYMESCLPPLTL
jgi:hypothetical protein